MAAAWRSAGVGLVSGIVGAASSQRRRPAAGGGAGSGSFAEGRGLRGGGFATWVHHAAKLVEAVGGGEAGGGKLPECVLYLRAGEAEDALQVVREACPALAEDDADGEGVWAERAQRA